MLFAAFQVVGRPGADGAAALGHPRGDGRRGPGDGAVGDGGGTGPFSVHGADAAFDLRGGRPGLRANVGPPAPGGAWCSAGVPIFDKMSECGSYPMFRHFDFKEVDVTHFANLDCQTPYYFVCLESGKYNDHVINLFVEQMIRLQQNYNFDGFRVDHIDHIVDEISEKSGVPISYRAPRLVLNRLNTALKSRIPHFAILAEYMLWDKFYKEYHIDMKFDL
ncbi:MAG: hypothetical protein IKQ80_00595, partial [Clostridia bacterium]|nr:hypothetical protein [Clostridia bacterium]